MVTSKLNVTIIRIKNPFCSFTCVNTHMYYIQNITYHNAYYMECNQIWNGIFLMFSIKMQCYYNFLFTNFKSLLKFYIWSFTFEILHLKSYSFPHNCFTNEQALIPFITQWLEMKVEYSLRSLDLYKCGIE